MRGRRTSDSAVALVVVGEVAHHRAAACAQVAVYLRSRHGRRLVDAHLSADPDLAGGCCPQHADVLRQGRPQPGGGALRTVDELLAGFPGCLVAAVATRAGGCVLGARDGGRVLAVPERGGRTMTRTDRAALASFLHATLVLGVRWSALRSIGVSVVPPAGRATRATVATRLTRVRLRPIAPPAAAGAARRALT
ncbi:hypothetical protein SAMN05216223_101287 [Actinacidiphila yanglinensis]|uniref:Uncharacterized protein n=1 Tax=Actinacidiphila yanglinensis TaxID=310779 RepID=A0A1H5SUV6_9ACTN|nr:hypothetical protein [Actinacidiphila yanglinensis]SEF54373.1 hypothetical protein SAMN05216223_101287 [Actinacidiphila yanglinensis]